MHLHSGCACGAVLIMPLHSVEVEPSAGKAMYEGIIVELPLAAFFLKKLRGGSSDLNDLPSLDRQLYDNMMKLTHLSLDLETVGVQFTIISKTSGVDCEVPLMPGAATLLWSMYTVATRAAAVGSRLIAYVGVAVCVPSACITLLPLAKHYVM